jgi:hypothetical protein
VVKGFSRFLHAQRYLLIGLAIVTVLAVDTCISEREREERKSPRAQYGTIVFEGKLDPRLKLMAEWGYYSSTESWMCRSGYSFAVGKWTGKSGPTQRAHARLESDGRYRLVVELEPPPKKLLFDCKWLLAGPHLYVALSDGRLYERASYLSVSASPKSTIGCQVMTTDHSRASCPMQSISFDPVYGGKREIQVDVILEDESR